MSLRGKTITFAGVLRIVLLSWKPGTMYMFTLSRSGSVRTTLVREGHPTRSKNWTRRRDHKRFLERVAKARTQ